MRWYTMVLLERCVVALRTNGGILYVRNDPQSRVTPTGSAPPRKCRAAPEPTDCPSQAIPAPLLLAQGLRGRKRRPNPDRPSRTPALCPSHVHLRVLGARAAAHPGQTPFCSMLSDGGRRARGLPGHSAVH